MSDVVREQRDGDSVDESDHAGEPADEAPQRARELSAAELERRAAALAEIRVFGDPVLRSRASDVGDFGPGLAREAERMVGLMRDAVGVGLAATQLGVMRRLLVFQAGLEATPTALANPVVEWLSDEQTIAEEGCLSLPRVSVDVERSVYARVRGQDVRGEPILIEASGLEARVLQHEIDHLDGVLMLDRAERQQRKAALRALREGTAYSPSEGDEVAVAPEASPGQAAAPAAATGGPAHGDA